VIPRRRLLTKRLKVNTWISMSSERPRAVAKGHVTLCKEDSFEG